ncbi:MULTISPECIES: nucleotidyltransferase domain-containing protein [unclassified Nocardioides]|uniref:nucleotidyltransferase domain-containing protein n=1 Tax=unclassified Nocardioides TaxID=2615069 RepID=UPI0030155D69
MYFNQPFGGVMPGARGAVLAVLLRTGEPLTGRQIHGIVSDEHSLWSVQEALKALTDLGLVTSRTVGRAGIHEINEAHASVAPLRALLDPIASLRAAVSEAVGSEVEAVLLFGSIARGEATEASDVDLAVIAAASWGGRVELEDTVRARLGNDCDVLVFTPAEFAERAQEAEPVVADIVRDGVALVGRKPVLSRGAA